MAPPESSQVSEIGRLRVAVTDDRAENSTYKQKELFNLHTGLRARAGEICAAISQDSQGSAADVETEFFLAMSAIRDYYESIDFAQELKDEYLVTTGVDNPSRKVGVGLVVIRPTTYTRFYSVISPIAAAIAAGNCVLLELEPTLLKVDSVLNEALPYALDSETFCISSRKLQEYDLASCMLVDQTGRAAPMAQILLSSEARAIAIVDRSADIHAAARAIVTARFSFQGLSPYAPDLVLVDEFVKLDFFKACTRYASQSFASQSATRSTNNSTEVTQEAIKDGQEKGQLSCLSASNFSLVDVSERSSAVTSMKIHGLYLPVITCSSLNDAIASQNSESTLLAGYFFADPKAGKLLSQQLDCHINFINQIPIHLLVGPPAPLSHPPSHPYRYSKEHFSASRPQFITTNPDSYMLSSMFLSAGAGKGPDSYTGASGIPPSTIRSIAAAALPKMKKPGQAAGFFGQRLITGTMVLFGVVVPAVGYGVWQGWEILRIAK